MELFTFSFLSTSKRQTLLKVTQTGLLHKYFIQQWPSTEMNKFSDTFPHCTKGEEHKINIELKAKIGC